MPDPAEGVAVTRWTGRGVALAAAVSLLLNTSPPPAASGSTGTASVPGQGDREAVTFATLLAELADRDRLAVFPGDAWTQHQASSHDPRNAQGFSRLGAPWGFANVDFGNYLRQESKGEREEWVLLEESGPGALTRWWSVGIDDDLLATGTFRVHLDGSPTPVLEASAVDLVGGDRSGFGPSLNFGTPERGGNLYAPIPYRSGIKVTWDGPTTHGGKDVASRDPALKHSAASALWYNINFRRFREGTNVASLAPSTAAEARESLERVNQSLGRPEVTAAAPKKRWAEERLERGGAVSHRFVGPGAIRRLRVKVSGDDQVSALHGTTLVLTFDGQETTRVPVAQFFGNGDSEDAKNPYNEGGDFARRVDASEGMTAYWVMPFQDEAEVRILNESDQAVDAVLEVDVGDWAWDERSMHFHADYRWERGIRTRSAGDAPWPGVAGKRELYSAEGDAHFRFIDIRGRGVYVGDTLSIRNRSTGPGLNTWWGEGDEKIYVDYLDGTGDGSTAVPVHRGTGTEDYYGYSFGSGQEFTSPFVTQPLAAGNRKDDGALTVNGRVRGLDAIPFHQSFKFDMELWKWREGIVDVAAATFWYGVPGAFSLSVAADLAVDCRTARDRGIPADTGVPDTAGDGRWLFLSADGTDTVASTTELASLTWGSVGDRGARGYAAREDGGSVPPALAADFIFETGRDNDPIDRSGPGYHEVLLQPGSGDAARPFVVARWVAGESSRGPVNVSGVIRNLVTRGDGPDFSIAVNGELAFQAVAGPSGHGTLEETYFDFDTVVDAGQFVDFVLGNGGRGDAVGDESALRAVIRARNDE
jgi:hypothetical protein